MSADAAIPLTPGPAPSASGPGWIDVPEAARRGGWNEGHVGRLCRSSWSARGLARLEKPEDGGKPRWLVYETADVRLARVKTAAVLSAAFDPTCLTEAQRRALEDRLRLVRRWEQELAAGATLDLTEAKVTGNFLNRLLIDENRTLSRATLYNWLAGYRRQGVGGLVDKRWLPPSRGEGGGEGRGEGAGGDPFIDFVKRLYLDARRRTLRRCHIAAEEKALEAGWTPRSYKACQRAMADLPRAVVTRFREGEKAFEDRHEPAIRRDYSTIGSDDVWCGDHHDFDVMVEHDGKFVRPTVTAWQDVRSRKVLGWKVFAHAPNADTILAAFEIAAKTHGGVPGRVYVDNGKDYRSSALQGNDKTRVEGAFTILGVEAQHCWIYHGQSKPIERNFRTICDQFAREFDTYCGNKPGNRPEDLQRNLKGGKAPTLDEFAQAFTAYVADDYNTAPHTGDAMEGKAPDVVYAEQNAGKRPVLDEVLDFACMPRFCPVVKRRGAGGGEHRGVLIGKQGVTYRGLYFGAFDPDVQRLHGQRVQLAVNNDDLSSVLVLSLEGRLLCRAKANTKLGWNATTEDLRAAVAEKKKLRRTLREYVDQRPRMADDVQELTQRAASRRRSSIDAAAKHDPLPPAPLRHHRTGVDEQLPAIRRALEPARFRDAVGAESAPLPAMPSRFTYGQAAASEDATPAAASPSFRELMASQAPSSEESL